MGKDNKKTLLRYFSVLLLLGLTGALVIAKTIIVMFAERQYWNDVSKNSVVWNISISPRRGNILSDEGLLMASSMPQYRIYLDFLSSEKNEKRRLSDQQKKDTLFSNNLSEISHSLHQIFPRISEQEFKNHLRNGRNQRSRHHILMPNRAAITYNQYKAVKRLTWLSGRYEGWFYSEDCSITRKKPFGSLATRTLGDLFGAIDSARYGLELSFDSLLRGKPGVGHQERIQNTLRVVPDKLQEDGNDIVTTLNVEMQDIVDQALLRELELIGAVSGVAVLMEVATGDIKAIANLTLTNDGHYYEVQNNAVRDILEPGSTFKPVSIMVALEDGLISIKDSMDCNNGAYKFSGVEMRDHNWNHGGYGVLSVPEILMYSSNIGTARLINEKYKDNPEKFIQGVCKIGMDKHFDLQLTGTGSPVIKHVNQVEYWDATRLPWMAIGYNTQLPVVNTLAFFNAIANDGKMLEPRLVKRMQKDGRVIKEYPVTIVNKKICSDKTLRDMRYMLERVVSEGLGKQAGSKYFSVAGKTGTAQVSQGAAGYKVGRTNYLVSFCGYFPADKPQYSCIVAIRTIGGIASGGGIAGPVFHEISEKVMARTQIRSLILAKDTIRAIMPKVLSGNLNKATQVLKKLNLQVEWSEKPSGKKDSIWGVAILDDNNLLLTEKNYRNNMVPNVVGMGAEDALYLLESVGFRVVLQGVGKVYSQSMRPGERLSKGASITIKLRI